MVNDPWPPGGGNGAGLPVAVTAHRSAVGAEMDVSVSLHAMSADAAPAARIAAIWTRHRIRFTSAAHRKRFASSADGRGSRW
jgi:hypothetical protein